MLKGWSAVYYRELLILRRRLSRLLASMSVSPLLYLIAFGYAMGNEVRIEGHTYMEFLIPGLTAMSSMTQSFAIASEINISRFYWHIFEEFQSAPLSSRPWPFWEGPFSLWTDFPHGRRNCCFFCRSPMRRTASVPPLSENSLTCFPILFCCLPG